MTKVRPWLSDSLVRHFPRSRTPRGKPLRLLAARGERVSFQACLHNGGNDPLKVEASVRAPAGVSARVRRIGCVPMPHHNTQTPRDELDGLGHIPGYVPDPLFDEQTALAAPGEITCFWITLEIPKNVRPGTKRIHVTVRCDDRQSVAMTATLTVSKIVLSEPAHFHATNWFYADALCDWYKVTPFGRDFWPICVRYMRDYAQHGLDTIYVPVFTPPLDGVKRPTQLLKVTRTKPGRYRFDWKKVRQWVDLAKRCGLRRFEWTHLFTQWGAANAIRIYENHGEDERLLWRPGTPATSKTYRGFLEQFLPALERFLKREKLMKRSFFHVSDEPHGEEHRRNYRKARAMLAEVAPWMKVMDALSEIEFGREGLVDIPIPSIKVTKRFVDEGIPCWTYFCCGPRGEYLNRLLDTPLAKIRMSGWLFWRFGVRGFLHWGYNYWYESQTRRLIDPFTVTDGLRWPGWACGDTFQVYPGPDGPIDSIRWEVFAESLQDYALLQMLGIDRDGVLLRPLKDFDDFPKNASWIVKARQTLLV